jgi:branched-chain amino acid transport system permease protein
VGSLAELLLRAMQTGALYALIALGLNVVFASTNVFSFAHGDIVMVGGMLGAVLLTAGHLPTVVALAVVVILCGGIGGLTEVIAVRPTARLKATSAWVLSTLGAAIIIRTTTTVFVTREPGSLPTRTFPDFWPGPPTFRIGSTTVSMARLMLIPTAILVTLGLLLFMRRTSIGRALGAVADDRQAARMRGLPVNQLALLSFVIGGCLAAIAGFAAGPVTQASVEVGLALTLKGFIAAAIGGIPELGGALAGGFVLALAEQFAVTYGDSHLEGPISLLVLIVVLLVRPQGILGREVRTV